MRDIKVLGLLMRTVERLLWISGCLMLSVFLGHLALAEYQRARSVAAFKTQMVARVASPAINLDVGAPVDSADMAGEQSLDSLVSLCGLALRSDRGWIARLHPLKKD